MDWRNKLNKSKKQLNKEVIMQSQFNIAKVIVVSILSVFCLIGSFKVFENVGADEIIVIQSPLSGKLSWYTSPGVKWQGFGSVTTYYKLDIYEFNIGVRFNDGGHGTIIGSINYELPLDKEHLTQLHTKYGSQDAVQKQLIETVTNKCVYMTGPLMSSKESYAEKRTSLIRYIEDQIALGIYKTVQKETKTKDPVTGAEKTVSVVEIITNQTGQPERQEEAVLTSYGIKTSNFAVSNMPYDDAVEAQIKQQQAINMDVQTAIADAKKAEQNAITVAKQGEANAARAKWEQEVIKAKVVTEAQQKLEVATLDAKSAEQMKRKDILLGEGEATRKRLVMSADGALTQKLAAWENVMGVFAVEFAKQKWTPEIIMGSDGNKSNGAIDLINMLSVKTAKDLSLNMNMKGQ